MVVAVLGLCCLAALSRAPDGDSLAKHLEPRARVVALGGSSNGMYEPATRGTDEARLRMHEPGRPHN